MLAGEDEREGGALLYFNLPAPLPITDAGREHPSPSAFLQLARQNPAAHVEVREGVRQALTALVEEPVVVVSGSLYLIGEAMEALELTTVPPADERGLNEWLPSARK